MLGGGRYNTHRKNLLVNNRTGLESLVASLPSLSYKEVVIIGWPASGKSTVAELLKPIYPTHSFIHTDSYINPAQDNYKEALYVMIADMKGIPTPRIIEGIQGYRLLRKGVEENNYYPHLVIEMKIKRNTLEARYEQHRKGKDIGAALAWAEMHESILRKYKAMKNPLPPEWIELRND